MNGNIINNGVILQVKTKYDLYLVLFKYVISILTFWIQVFIKNNCSVISCCLSETKITADYVVLYELIEKKLNKLNITKIR